MQRPEHDGGKGVRTMATKRELQERVGELEEVLEEVYDRIGDLLDLEDAKNPDEEES